MIISRSPFLVSLNQGMCFATFVFNPALYLSLSLSSALLLFFFEFRVPTFFSVAHFFLFCFFGSSLDFAAS